MKLAEWARQQGLDDKTAYRWFRAGILPVPSKQLLTGAILVEPVPLAEKRGAAVYARVSSGDPKQARHANRPQHCSEELGQVG
jgi:putative resolvase